MNHNFIFLLFVMIFPNLASVQAIDCSTLTNQQICQEIQSSDASSEEKAYLLADIMSFTKHYPDHQLVKEWNNKINLAQKPIEISIKNNGVIRNAWVKVFAVMPSVLYENTLLISTDGEVLTGSNYQIQIPSGRVYGDCRTDRTLYRERAVLNVYVDTILQGNGQKVQYHLSAADNSSANIKAEYIIEATTRIKHYRNVYEELFGVRRRVCRYQYTEYKTDRVTITDEIQAIIHNPALQASFTTLDQYDDTTRGRFIVNEDAVNAELLFDNSSFKQHNFVFSEITTLPPLNVLNVKAEKLSNTEEQNVAYNDGVVTLKNIHGCNIKVSDFFKTEIFACDFATEFPEFTFSTDKLVYEEGEPINITIEPREQDYIIEYADEQMPAGAEIIAKSPYNKITVKLGNKTVDKYIHVKDEEPITAGFSIAIFGTLNYALIGLVKRFWGVIG